MMLARLTRKTAGLLLLAVLLVPALSLPGLADEATVVAKVISEPQFKIVFCFVGQVPFATIQTLRGRPLCGPAPVTVFPQLRQAFFTCQTGTRIISFSIVAERQQVLFNAADNRGNSVFGNLCPE